MKTVLEHKWNSIKSTNNNLMTNLITIEFTAVSEVIDFLT